MVWVTGMRDRERWMTFEESVHWEESWEGIDLVAKAIAGSYASKLEEAKTAEARKR